jgi:hypothetical protein
MSAASLAAAALRNEARVLRLIPSLRTAWLATVEGILQNLRMRALFQPGQSSRVLETLFASPEIEALSLAERATWRDAYAQAGTWAQRDLPSRYVRGPFDVTSVSSLRVLRRWETRIFDLQLDVAKQGLHYGSELAWVRGMKAEARYRLVGNSVGIGPTSWDWVTSYRDDLLAGEVGSARGRRLHDQRYKLRGIPKEGLSEEAVDNLVAKYAKRVQRYRENTAIRTAGLNAYRAGQQESVEQAIALNGVNASLFRRRWITRLDGKERPTHHDMNGELVGINEPWIVDGVGPQMTPGEDEFNCRCTVGYVIGVPKK